MSGTDGPCYRIAQAADLLGGSPDTVRRWIAAGRLPDGSDESGRTVVDGAGLAQLAQELSTAPEGVHQSASSARNRFVGLVTGIKKDTVMAQVDIQAGPHRVVSLISREALDDLGLQLGSLAVATVKATNVIVESPES